MNDNNEFVGDPIIDSGLMAIKLLAKKEINKCSKKELKKIADNLVELYLTPAWSKDILSIFPNSTYVQYAKNYNRKVKSKELLYELIDGLNSSENDKDYCIFCGKLAYKRKDDKSFVKTQIPLVGSTEFVNFFPSFKNGIDICARCALAIQFAPILFYKTGGKPSCISCNNKNVIETLGKECIEYINQNKVLNAFENRDFSGTFDEGFKSPQNALFHLAYKLFTNYRKIGILNGNEEIIIYYIDNYNQNPKGIQIYKLPNNIFRFVGIVMNSPEFKKSWYDLLSKHYIYKRSEKEDNLQIEKIKPNRIYKALLENKSILKYFKSNDTKKLIVPWIIVERYMELVRGMNKQKIEAIKNFADKIATCIYESDKKKRVNDIVSAKDFATFRNQLRLIFRDWQKLGKNEPMITYDEYISAVIPEDYYNWKEIQDLIIIRLYEKLHSALSNTNEDDESKDDEE